MEWDKRAFLLTAGIYSLLFVLFLFVLAFKTPLPLPGEEGMLIDFGDSETGMGAIEPRKVEKVQPQEQVRQQESNPEPVEQTQMTQDFEDAPAVNAPKEQKTTPDPKKTEKKEEPKEEKKPQVNQRALFGPNRNSTSNSSEGVAGGEGNQGDPNGDPESDNHSLGGGLGDGPSYSLAGRSAVNLPTPRNEHQKEGKVVVQVTVDRLGRVTKAIPGVKGSTTLDSQLLALAKAAALNSKFNTKDDAPLYQTGTITYVFSLR